MLSGALLLFWAVIACGAAEDPDESRNATELISSKGYAVEDHVVQTDDGYLIHVHRIPCRKYEAGTMACSVSRPVVFLVHGLECDSTNWITNLANESLGFILADAGYDVWMGNMRGNTYAKEHITLSPKEAAFWAFSFDDMATHDIPSMVNYVLKVTGRDDLYYAGHSQGTLVGFIQFSQDLEFAKKIKHFYAMGPVATVGHIKGPLKLIAPLTKLVDIKHFYAMGPVATVGHIDGPLKLISPLTKTMDVFLTTFGVNDFNLPPKFTKAFADIVCKGDLGNPLCVSILFLICGPDSQQLNRTRIPVYLAHTPAGTSTKNFAHFGQMVNSGRFCKYDYGMLKNKEIYGTYWPPSYDASKMQVPVSLFWGAKDWLADPKDIEENLLPNLQNVKGNYELQTFNHLDFIWGMNAPQAVYSKIIQSIKEQEGQLP